jgi:hypothetical protein
MPAPRDLAGVFRTNSSAYAGRDIRYTRIAACSHPTALPDSGSSNSWAYPRAALPSYLPSVPAQCRYAARDCRAIPLGVEFPHSGSGWLGTDCPPIYKLGRPVAPPNLEAVKENLWHRSGWFPKTKPSAA